MSLSPINGLKKFNIVLVVYKHFVPPALSPTNFRFVAGSFQSAIRVRTASGSDRIAHSTKKEMERLWLV